MIDAIKRMFGIHIHQWGKWVKKSAMSTIYGGLLHPQAGKKIGETLDEWQERKCETCGFTERSNLPRPE